MCKTNGIQPTLLNSNDSGVDLVSGSARVPDGCDFFVMFSIKCLLQESLQTVGLLVSYSLVRIEMRGKHFGNIRCDWHSV